MQYSLCEMLVCVSEVDVVGRYKSLEIVFYVLLGVAPSVIVFEMVRLQSSCSK